LQAAGVLAIKKDSKTTIIIYQQNKEPESILIHNQDIGPILGQTFSFQEVRKKLPKQIMSFTQFTPLTDFTDSIENQIYFIKTLSSLEELVIIGIGEGIEQKKIDTLLGHIHKKSSDAITLFVNNFSHEKEFELCRKDDDAMITNIISHKVKSTNENRYQLPKIFSDYSKKLKRTPAIVAYTNTGDL